MLQRSKKTDTCTAPEIAKTSSFRRGEPIYQAATAGKAWRVITGSVRLDRTEADVVMFAGLAVKGDIIGAETLLFGHYSFDAKALSDCALEPWQADAARPLGETLLETLTAAERRAADVISLRCGQAVDRVTRLIHLLAKENATKAAAQVAMPGVRDMAEITDLTVETISRIISRLTKIGALSRLGQRRVLLRRFPLQAFPA